MRFQPETDYPIEDDGEAEWDASDPDGYLAKSNGDG